MSEATPIRAQRAWCMYDWANSAFATICMTAVLPPYLAGLVNKELGAPAGTAVWGWVAVAGLAVGAVLGPPLGALADSRGWRIRMLAGFALLGAVATAGLGVVLPGSWRWAAVLYVLGATGFGGGNIFYDSLLPSVAPRRSWDELSARGYAYGYVGGGIALAVVAALAMRDPAAGPRLGLLITGVWWAVFSLPVLLWVREPAAVPAGGAFARLARTFREARRRKVLWRFLLAYWLYNDGIGTIIKMAGAYGAEVGIPLKHMLGALLLTQAVAAPATLAAGRLGARYGARRGIVVALTGYVAIGVLGVFLRHAWQFWVLAGLVGLVQGGAQALSRSLYARLVPAGREAEFFSFFDVSGRFAGIVGPALFSLGVMVAGSGRVGAALVVGFFVAGLVLLRSVPEEPVEDVP